jgi:Putative DNA-binding domain
MSVPHDFDAISSDHIQDLVDTLRAEDRTIDFKRDWDDATFDGLSKDVCAFANTDGGDIVVGVTDVNRIASSFPGVTGADADRRIRNAETSIRSKIEPRVHGLRIRYVEREGKPGAFVLRVSPSSTGPHRLIQNGAFYSRGSAGNRDMDIFQVREAFLRGTLAEERIREFRAKRISGLDRTNPGLSGLQYAWALFQVVSIPALMRPQLLSGQQLYDSANSLRIFDALGEGATRTFNLDGVKKGRGELTVQLFRDGRVEAQRRLGKASNAIATTQAPERIPLELIRNGVRSSLKDYVHCLESLGCPPPYSISLSLVNVELFQFTARDLDVTSPDRNNMEFPDVTIPDTQIGSISSAIGSLTDMMYQAFGQAATLG